VAAVIGDETGPRAAIQTPAVVTTPARPTVDTDSRDAALATFGAAAGLAVVSVLAAVTIRHGGRRHWRPASRHPEGAALAGRG
jgi:hypothetical protein